MKTLASCTLLFASIFSSVSLMAQDQVSTASSTSQSSNALPTEIIVTPLMNRRNLRSLISQVEEDFVKRFNELNLDDDYDVDCYSYTSTGTHLTKEICEPKFFRDSRREDAQTAAININQRKKGAPVIAVLEAVQVQSDEELALGVKEKYAIMQEKVAELTNSDEALKVLIGNLNELNYALENYDKDD